MTENDERLQNGSPREAEIETPSEDNASSSRQRETPQTEADQARMVEELLAGLDRNETDGDPHETDKEEPAQPASSEDHSATGTEPEQPREPMTLASMAEKLDVEVSELYKLEVKAGDGSTVTLSDLKDAWQERETAARETAKRAAELDERESALIADQRIFAEMGDQLATALPEQTRQQLRQHLEARTEVEHRKMLQTMPELAEPETFNAFKADVVSTLERYGFRPGEMQITDHRHLHILRDLIRLEKRQAKLSKWSPEAKPQRAAQPRKADPGAKSKQVLTKARRGSEADKVAGVAQILRGS